MGASSFGSGPRRPCRTVARCLPIRQRPRNPVGGAGVSAMYPLGGTMKIGIIGAGNIGGTLARRLAALGHQVSVANSRGPESLAAFARESGARAVTVEEAARAGDVVIVSIPFKNISRLPRDLFTGVP